MLRALDKAGFKVVDNPYVAEIIIGHSGGCLLVPDDLPARHIFLVGPTYWPGRSMLRSLLEKNASDFKSHRRGRLARQWADKFRWNVYYFWNMPRNIAMLCALKNPPSWRARHVTVVRNHDDSFCTPDFNSLPFTHKARFIELPGQHDDIWLHPEPYIQLLQSICRAGAAA